MIKICSGEANVQFLRASETETCDFKAPFRLEINFWKPYVNNMVDASFNVIIWEGE